VTRGPRPHVKLKRQFGLRGIVLKWFQSYLCDIIFQVVYNGSTSYTVHVMCSVPQGLVLSLQLFIMYTADLEEKADEHGVNCHAFADDTQLNEPCRFDDTLTAVGKLEYCVTDISITGCRHTASSKIQRKQNSCGWVPSTIWVNLMVVARRSSLALTPSNPVDMYAS